MKVKTDDIESGEDIDGEVDEFFDAVSEFDEVEVFCF